MSLNNATFYHRWDKRVLFSEISPKPRSLYVTAYIFCDGMSTVKIAEEHKEWIDGVAEQLNTSRKAVVDMVFDWFFSSQVEAEEEEDEEE